MFRMSPISWLLYGVVAFFVVSLVVGLYGMNAR